MEIGKVGQPKSELESVQSNSKLNAASAASVILGINKKKVKIHKAKIRDVARGLAEVAYSMGETNDPDEFADIMAEDIYEALKSIEEKHDKTKKKKK
jgi:glucan biosynthesis protein